MYNNKSSMWNESNQYKIDSISNRNQKNNTYKCKSVSMNKINMEIEDEMLYIYSIYI